MAKRCRKCGNKNVTAPKVAGVFVGDIKNLRKTLLGQTPTPAQPSGTQDSLYHQQQQSASQQSA